MKPWVGFDLDGTLAHHDEWKGPLHIGPPTPLVAHLVQTYLHRQDLDVRIVTARVSPLGFVVMPGVKAPHFADGTREAQAILAAKAIHAWTKQHIGKALPVTCMKDYGMVRLYDDRAIQVITNTGKIVRTV